MTHIDEDADLFLRHQAALIEVATPILGCRSRAEDVVQDAYLRFTAARSGRSDILRPVNYLFQIVRRLAFDGARAQARERPGLGDSQFLEAMPAPAASPEQVAADRRDLALVATALAELPARTRLAFEMHRLGGHKLQDVAQALGISVTLAHQLVHKALAHCAARLADD